ncbi:MAG: flagellar motor protein MotB [Planctomycetota bacterium]
MADDKKLQPIIIKRRKKAHGGAHGGAWKIAYADLVTAMMAFFLVMWIIGMDVQTKQGIAEYFQNMSARARNAPASPHVVSFHGVPPVQPRERPVNPRDNNLDAPSGKQLASQIDGLIGSSPQLERMRSNFKAEVGEKEMKMTFQESQESSVFIGDSVELRPEAKLLIRSIGAILARNRSRMSIEGHWDAKPPPGGPNSKWELTTSRAVVMRGVLQEVGVTDDRILEVRGLADTKLLHLTDPLNSANRRVILVIPYDVPDGK